MRPPQNGIARRITFTKTFDQVAALEKTDFDAFALSNALSIEAAAQTTGERPDIYAPTFRADEFCAQLDNAYRTHIEANREGRDTEGRNTEGRNTIVTPGLGDRPQFTYDATGKLIYRFQTFNLIDQTRFVARQS